MIAAIEISTIESTDLFGDFLPPDLSKAAVLDIDLSRLPPEWVLLKWLRWQQRSIRQATIHCDVCLHYDRENIVNQCRGIKQITCNNCSASTVIDTMGIHPADIEQKAMQLMKTEEELKEHGLMEYIQNHLDYIHYFSIRIDNNFKHRYSNQDMRDDTKRAVANVMDRFYAKHPHLKRYETTT